MTLRDSILSIQNRCTADQAADPTDGTSVEAHVISVEFDAIWDALLLIADRCDTGTTPKE